MRGNNWSGSVMFLICCEVEGVGMINREFVYGPGRANNRSRSAFGSRNGEPTLKVQSLGLRSSLWCLGWEATSRTVVTRE